jgi:hypothetical protein
MPKYVPTNFVFGDLIAEARLATMETQHLLAAERSRPLGGIPDVGVTDTSYVDVPGAIVVRMTHAATAQLHAMGFVSGGTGSMQLYDITAAAAVTGSEVTFTDVTPTLQVTPDLELIAGHDYKLQVKVSSGTQHAVVYGASLVTQ